MNKHIFRYLILWGMTLLMGACNDSEKDLLKPKVYFEKKEYNVVMKDEADVMELDITSRLSNMMASEVEVSYSIAEAKVVEEYNARYGTNYQMFEPANAKLGKDNATIAQGQLYAGKVKLTLSHLNMLEEGKSYILPIRLNSSSVPTIAGTDIEYVILSKPVRITKVGTFTNHYISVKFPANTFFKSFTYEALVYAKSFYNSSHTVMGTEGVMILRVGDTGGGIPSNILQIAGRQHYEASEPLLPNKWYHLALTYDQASGKTVMYVNGAKWAESAWSIAGFDPNSDVGFYIGKLDGFPWGERPFNGYMSEVRVWSVARTENQIKQNMLGVDPKSDGLELYFKLNGSETTEGRNIKDVAKNLDGKSNGIVVKQLDTPIVVE